jgi:hypothetical protein
MIIMPFADVIKIFGFFNSVSQLCKVLTEKYCPERSGGAEIFSQTQRAQTLQNCWDTELPLPKI